MTTIREWGTGVLHGVRLTARGLLRRPAYTLLALATVVLGVGSVTAGYGLLHQVVLRPLPFEETDRLMALRTLYDSDVIGLTVPEYLEVEAHADAFQSVAALVEPHLDDDWIWTGPGEPRPLSAVRVTAGFFNTLGVVPALGALASDALPGERHVIVSQDFWTRLGGDADVVGSTLQINHAPYGIIGVLPASFEFPLGAEPTDVWILFTPEPVEIRAGIPLSHRAIGRLAPGVERDRAADQVTGLVAELRASIGDSPGRLVVRPIEEDLLGSARRPLLLLTLAASLVLFVASVNLSLMIAARNVERAQELSVRTALGASPGQILRHLLAEAGVLAIAGGMVALGAAVLVLRRVSEGRVRGLERMGGIDLHLGWEIVAVGLAAALVPALVAAALPALRIKTGVDRLGTRGASADRRAKRFAGVLTGVESGLVFALLVAAALLLRSLQQVTAVDPGFDTTSTVALTVFLPPPEPGSNGLEAAESFTLALEDRLRSLPDVAAAGAITNLPLSPESWSGSLMIEGRDDIGVEGADVVVDWELVSPGYFDAVGIPVLQGRAFDARDRSGSPDVVIVNQSMARRWWPGGDPIGARISGGGPPRTVVGVVGDVKQQDLHTGTRGFMYLPSLQLGLSSKQEIVVRVRGYSPTAVVDQVRTELLEVEPSLAVAGVRTLDELVNDSSGPFRLRALLVGAFGAMGLLLGVAGIYGVTAHGVRTRRRDIGIRIAMGADGARIMTNVLFEALVPVALGLAGGLVMILMAGPLLSSLLFGVVPTDLTALTSIAVILLASAVAAVAPSALRARRVDAASMFRED